MVYFYHNDFLIIANSHFFSKNGWTIEYWNL